MDKWTAEQMKTMQVGGNEAARNFFKDKGWSSDVSAQVRVRERRWVGACGAQHLRVAWGDRYNGERIGGGVTTRRHANDN